MHSTRALNSTFDQWAIVSSGDRPRDVDGRRPRRRSGRASCPSPGSLVGAGECLLESSPGQRDGLHEVVGEVASRRAYASCSSAPAGSGPRPTGRAGGAQGRSPLRCARATPRASRDGAPRCSRSPGPPDRTAGPAQQSGQRRPSPSSVAHAVAVPAAEREALQGAELALEQPPEDRDQDVGGRSEAPRRIRSSRSLRGPRRSRSRTRACSRRWRRTSTARTFAPRRARPR